MSNQFKKFMQSADSGARKKERIRQEKKKVRQETKEYFEKKKEEIKMLRAQGGVHKKADGARHKTQGAREEGDRSQAGARKSFDRPQKKSYRAGDNLKRKSFEKPQATDRKTFGDRSQNTGRKPISDKSQNTGRKPYAAGNRPQPAERKPIELTYNTKSKQSIAKPAKTSDKKQEAAPSKAESSVMPLNKFIAHAGICSRRDAAEMVKAGKVTVNGEKVIEPGHKVSGKDDIKFNGKKISLRRNLVYILLNKPKDFITTTEDPQGRKTVLDIVKQATTERVYPIGRLDRNTTGVLLLTNDGELAQKLSHPSYEIKKIYEVKLDKPLVKKDYDALLQGITLEDGFIQPDALAYADSKDKSIIGIEIHSGRNRIVRRIFEKLGYDVRNLDRVMYANLTKKNVDRGKWRFLSEKEIRLLKFLNTSFTKKNR
jgi:23S rRNA pseudouridine2605 synthase